jgi:hypothetical protein
VSDGTDDDSLDRDDEGAFEAEADACSRLVRLSASRANGEPLRFLTPRDELLELCADLTRSHESNEISAEISNRSVKL